jgi:hypothetical protein
MYPELYQKWFNATLNPSELVLIEILMNIVGLLSKAEGLTSTPSGRKHENKGQKLDNNYTISDTIIISIPYLHQEKV